MLLTSALMLRHLGFEREALALEQAVTRCLREKKTTTDAGGTLSTEQATAAVLEALAI
jgi:isocitrate/isopropylmalate dehydrogenase